MNKKITKNTTLAEVLEFPKARKILVKYNLPCLACPFAKLEMDKLKLGRICQLYGIDLESLLRELNKNIK